MGARVSTLKQADCNEVFTYQVPVVAVIKDWRLGLLHYFLLLLIFIYIVVYHLWYLGGYLSKPQLEMEMRATLRAPHSMRSTQNLSYCCENPQCEDLTAKQKCLPFLGEEVSIHQPNRFTVVTHKKLKSRMLGNNLTQSNEDHFFARDIEHFTMKISPTIYTSSKDAKDKTMMLTGHQLQGRLFVGHVNRAGTESKADSEVQHQLCWERSKMQRAFDNSYGNVSKSNAPCYIDPDHVVAGDDIYRIETLLRAMGFEENALDVAREGGGRVRMRGVQVIVDVTIVSFEPRLSRLDGRVTPHYFLSQLPVENSVHSVEFGVSDSFEFGVSDSFNGRTRQAVENYGIYFIFTVRGTLAHFTWFGLLTELSASFALLALSAAAVKYLALYVLPLGNVYHGAMHRTSPNIDGVRKLLSKKDDKIKTAHKKYFHHDNGLKEDFVLRLRASHIDVSSDEESSESSFSSMEHEKNQGQP